MAKQETSDDGLPPDEIIRRIEKALAHGGNTHSWDDVRHGLIEGEFQIFYNAGGVCITEIVQSPRIRTLHVFVAAGLKDAVLALQPDLVAFGLSQGCSRITAVGRFGWGKILPKLGWKKAHVAMTFDLRGLA